MKLISRTVAYIAIAALFNVIFFMVGGVNHSSTTWIAYGFVLFTMIISYITPLFCRHYKRIPENFVTIYIFAWIYVAVSLITNFIFIVTKLNNYKFVLVINLAIVVLYLIVFLVNLNINSKVEENLEHLDAERQFVRNASQKIKYCLELISEKSVGKLVEKAYDELRTSPVHSNEQVMNYELEVIRLVDELELKCENKDWSAVSDTSRKIIETVRKRNSILENI